MKEINLTPDLRLKKRNITELAKKGLSISQISQVLNEDELDLIELANNFHIQTSIIGLSNFNPKDYTPLEKPQVQNGELNKAKELALNDCRPQVLWLIFNRFKVESIKIALLNNPNTPISLLKHLSMDKDRKIKKAAKAILEAQKQIDSVFNN